MARLLCLHGHFYQPPRENPWIEEIETQDSAEPFHDWNERITAECYGPNGAARLKTDGDRIADIVDNYLHLSFNFGPTLLAWLERFRPGVYANVLESDARSVQQRGHGNAIAQGYSHAILPLASTRDRLTQIRWGIADFRHRFRREPEGFWLPETAADSATLEAIAEEGIRYTILSPYQARRVRPLGGEWSDATDARFDPTRPYRVRAGDREIVVFFYDGHIARDLAFGDLLASADRLAKRLEGGFDPNRGHDEILTVAFDGETLGHHRKGGDETLAAAVRALSRSEELEIVNPGQALERVPVEWEAEISEPSSWSCAHGVERWRSDCGCQAGGEPGWKQTWRAPLLTALEALRERLAASYQAGMAPFVPDPWATRDRFIELVLDPERREVAEFLRREAGRALSHAETVRALRLLEMQRQSLLMFTSCGWFFSEISGIETVQVMKYAARAIQLVRDVEGEDLEPDFVAALALAPSNVPAIGDGRRAYETLVRPSVVTLEGIAAHLAISSAAHEADEKGSVFCYRYEIGHRRTTTSPPATLTLSRIQLESMTTVETLDVLCCVLHLGAADFRCGIVPWRGVEHLGNVEAVLVAKLERAGFSRVLREIDRTFPGRDYSLRDLFLDERRRVAAALLDGTLRRYEAHYREIFDDNLRLMEFLREIDSPVPGPIRVAADVTLSGRLIELTRRTRSGEVSIADAYVEMLAVTRMASRLGAHLHLEPVRRGVEALVLERLGDLQAGRAPEARVREVWEILEAMEQVGLRLDLWEAQNRLWAWAGAPPSRLDRDVAAGLARLLWFDSSAVLARAGYSIVAPLAAGASDGHAVA